METTDLKPAEFSCPAPDVQAVFVAGTFNDWNPTTLPRDRQADRQWRTVVPLLPGHDEFKFLVDSQWCCEPGCEHEYNGCPKGCPNSLGTMNRVLEV